MLGGHPAPVLFHTVDAAHAGYLLVAFCTHALVGYVLVATLTDARPWVGAAAGLAADADFLFPHALGFPFVHRGITHTPAALAGCLLIGYVLAAGSSSDFGDGTFAARNPLDVGDDVLAAVAVAYLSHLVVDSTTPMGVMWLYPLSTSSLGVDLGGHGPLVTPVVWAICGVVYVRYCGLPGDRSLELFTEDQEHHDAE